jgi:hypothetical protein
MHDILDVKQHSNPRGYWARRRFAYHRKKQEESQSPIRSITLLKTSAAIEIESIVTAAFANGKFIWV